MICESGIDFRIPQIQKYNKVSSITRSTEVSIETDGCFCWMA